MPNPLPSPKPDVNGLGAQARKRLEESFHNLTVTFEQDVQRIMLQHGGDRKKEGRTTDDAAELVLGAFGNYAKGMMEAHGHEHRQGYARLRDYDGSLQLFTDELLMDLLAGFEHLRKRYGPALRLDDFALAKRYASVRDSLEHEELCRWSEEAGELPESAVNSAAGPEEKTRANRRHRVVDPLLAEKGWVADHWASEANVDRNTVRDYLNGKIANPRPSTRKQLAVAIGLKPTELPR